MYDFRINLLHSNILFIRNKLNCPFFVNFISVSFRIKLLKNYIPLIWNMKEDVHLYFCMISRMKYCVTSTLHVERAVRLENQYSPTLITGTGGKSITIINNIFN